MEDAGVEDKRALIIEGEFAQCLRVMAREGNSLSTTIRNAWDRGDLGSLTKNNPTRATGAHISIIGNITKDELLRELGATSSTNGFANRMLFVPARRSKVLPDGGTLKEKDLAYLARYLGRVLDLGRDSVTISRDAEARTLWHEVYPSLSEGAPGLLGAVTSRGEAQVLRLSVIYAVLDGKRQVSVDHLRAALAVWDYCYRGAAFTFGDALGDPVADQLREALHAAGAVGLSRTTIRDGFGRHVPAARIDAALEVLAERGIAQGESTPTGGRPSMHWRACDQSDQSDQSPPGWTTCLHDQSDQEREDAEPVEP